MNKPTNEYYNISKKKTEILAPGGSFEKALYAFEGGADAVYIGLEKFSARFFSANFGFSSLEKLKKIAIERNKKIYITMNTVINEDEISDVIKFLIEIEIIGIDAIIIQDFGVLNILKKYFPKIPIHASTQMAIHNNTGVKIAKKLGISRVVLARELSFSEISQIRIENPDMELEVFIHGSLCYSFSGCCLVSGLTVSSDRSANRGKCSQVCRTWFDKKDNNKKKERGYYFSLKDLSLDEDIKKLVDIGIDSLKIEGRMKNSVYTKFSSQYYSSLLLGKTNAAEKSQFDKLQSLEPIKENLKLGFSRKETPFFLNHNLLKDQLNPTSLTDSSYSGHYGNKIGYISKLSTKKNNSGFFIESNKSNTISKRDGILFFDHKTGEPINISVDKFIESNGFVRSRALVNVNDPIYRTSKGNLNLKVINEDSFKLAKKSINLEISLIKKIESNLLSIDISFKLENVENCSSRVIYEVEYEESRSSKSIMSVFEEALNKNLFFFFNLVFISNEEDNIFLKLKDLKIIKKKLVAEIDEVMNRFKENRFSSILDDIEKLVTNQNEKIDFDIPNRKDIYFKKLPFLTEFDAKNPSSNFKIINNNNSYYFTALSPILLDTEENIFFIDSLSNYININQDKKFYIGINNISHLALLDKTIGGNCNFFLDFYIYTANINTINFFNNYDNRITFAYYWIENNDYENQKDLFRKFNIYPIINKNELKPPLFYSRVCFAKESMGISCDNCKKNFSFNLSQNGKDKTVIVKDCITYVI